MKEIQESLAKKLNEYIKIILEEYGEYIPEDKKEKLLLQQDYINCIKIEETKTISLFYRDNAIYFPKLAFLIINKLKERPDYGMVPNHKCYDQHTIVENKNTFTDYINHVIISGLTPKEYFEENLLHETLHFCGSDGSDPLREGFTELKTRELARKRNLLTSGCGYPKELAIVNKLQKILGEETANKITFAQSSKQISEILLADHGLDAENLYFSVRREMQRQFDIYYKEAYDGPDAPLKKASAYEQINYTQANNLIEEYQKKQELKQMLTPNSQSMTTTQKNSKK